MIDLMTDADLAEMHAVYEESLRDRANLLAPVETTASGQTVKTWPTVTTANVRCAVLDTPGAPGASQDYANSDLPNTRTIAFGQATTVGDGWRVVVTINRWSGHTFEVLKAQQPGTYGPAVQCECVEVTP